MIGDLHLDGKVGNKKVVDFFVNIENEIIKHIDNVDHIILLGDYGMTPKLDNPYRKILSEFIFKLNKPIICLLGQHDRDMTGHILQPLMPLLKQLKVVEDVYDFKDCTFISHDRDIEALEKKIKKAKGKYVFGHFNINSYNTGDVTLESNIYVETKGKKFYLGDIHKHQKNGDIIYIGSVAPVSLGQLDYDFKVLILDTESGKEQWIKLDHGTEILRIDDTKEGKEDGIEDGADLSNTRIIVKIRDPKQKIEWRKDLSGRNYLSLEFESADKNIEKITVDFNMKLSDIIVEYLDMMGKLHLKKKIMEYVKEAKK